MQPEILQDKLSEGGYYEYLYVDERILLILILEVVRTIWNECI